MYIIDGNNVLGFLGRDGSKDNRAFLVSYLKNALPKKRLVIVFDNLSQAHPDDDLRDPRCLILFSDPAVDKDADDRIIRFAAKRDRKDDVHLVTADNELILRSKGVGVRDIIHPQELIGSDEEHVPEPTKDDEYAGVDRESITDELKDIWSQ